MYKIKISGLKFKNRKNLQKPLPVLGHFATFLGFAWKNCIVLQP